MTIILEQLVGDSSITLREALELIEINGLSIIFLVCSETKILKGVLTDGDIRRALLDGADVSDCSSKWMNREPCVVFRDSRPKQADLNINGGIRVLPVLDSNKKIVDYINLDHKHQIPIYEPDLTGKELDYAVDCVKSSWISSQGKYVSLFESLFSSLHHNYHALSVSNGTTALQLALSLCNLKAGDEVIVPNLTFAATINAVINVGAIPVLVDVDPLSGCIDPELFERAITGKTKAVMPVHLYGNMCDMKQISQIANSRGLFVIEDCAEGLGSTISSTPAGCFGDFAAFSFFGNKTITTGEGGMLLCKNKEIFERAKILRDHGMDPQKRYWHIEYGFNFRLTNLQAAIGVAQLERFGEILSSKNKVSNYYNDLLSSSNHLNSFAVPTYQSFHSRWLHVVLVSEHIDVSNVQSKLLESGVDTRRLFYPLHLMPIYKSFARPESEFNGSQYLHNHGLLLPSTPTLSFQQVAYIASQLLLAVE